MTQRGALAGAGGCISALADLGLWRLAVAGQPTIRGARGGRGWSNSRQPHGVEVVHEGLGLRIGWTAPEPRVEHDDVTRNIPFHSRPQFVHLACRLGYYMRWRACMSAWSPVRGRGKELRL